MRYPVRHVTLFNLRRTLVVALMLWVAGAAHGASTDARTRHPIVLVHGLMGWDNILGLDYWYKIPAALRRSGATVLVAKVSAVNDNQVRGEQLLKQLREWQAAKGYTQFNLVGHSQGGPTARYVAGVAPALVASVTSVQSPHVIDAAEPDSILSVLSSAFVVAADEGGAPTFLLLLGPVAGGLVYLEAPASAGPPELPDGWSLLKSKRAGEVGYHLARREPTAGQ